MIDLLDEISEIPFEVFKDKWEEKKRGIFYDWSTAEMQWFYMKEPDRVMVFKALAMNHPSLISIDMPEEFLRQFTMPF